MSESAVVEVPPVVEPPSTFSFPGGIVDLIGSVSKKPEAVPAPPQKEESKPTPPVEEIKPPVVETPKEEPKPAPNSKEENLANLRKLVGEEKAKAEAFQKERDDWKRQFDEYRNRVPETAAEEAKRLKEQFETERKTREQIEKELKSSSYERSSEYRDTYVKPVQDAMKSMVDLAVEAGIDPAQAQSGINAWDKTKFSEWYSSMDDFQKGQFSMAMHTAQTTYKKSQEAVKNANENWDKIQQEKQQLAERQRTESTTSFRKLAEDTIAAFVNHDAIKDDQEVQEKLRKGVQKVAEQKFSPQELMQQAAALPIFHHMVQQGHKTIEAHEAKIAELQRKVDEQDAFIKAQTNGQPFPGSSHTPAGGAKEEPFIPWLQAKVG